MPPVKTDTLIAHAGNDPEAAHGAVNPPVYHASTILFPSIEAMERAERAPFDHFTYGRSGTPTTRAFEDAVARLEGGHRAVAVSSGLAAVATVIQAHARAGGHILVTDSAYQPTRRFCAEILSRFGVEAEFYDPRIGGGIERLIRPNTSLVFMESPGSLTFEVQDVPAIVRAAKARGVATAIDNTWATPLFFRPLEHGVDVSVHSATKYLVGHSDAMLGIAVCTEESFERVKRFVVQTGHSAAPDDLYLGLRGLRTLSVRLARHQETGLTLARWLQRRPEVARVLHPALPDDPGHPIWRRDFTGASGLFAIVLKPVGKAAVAALVDGLEFFGLGYSWGGYESLVVPGHPETCRTVTRWDPAGPLLRIHAGLEDPDDLIRDWEAGFRRLAAAR